MVVSVSNIVIVSLSILLIFVIVFLFTRDTSPAPFPSLLENIAAKSSSETQNVTGFSPAVPEAAPMDNELGFEKNFTWVLCEVPGAADYIPCLDNYQAIKRLKSKKRQQHKERHCPHPSPRCLVPLPSGYRRPVPWPKSRDMDDAEILAQSDSRGTSFKNADEAAISTNYKTHRSVIWYDNVPHPKLVEYKKDQNWVRKSGDYLVFPGGGTQFKYGVTNYVDFIEKAIPLISWGKNIRVVLDVGCGVASFGGYLLDKNVITMSFAPKDEHEAQIQFALERGIPATLAVIGTRQLPFSSNSFDLIHCARCRVHWEGDGGKPLLELNRILRPGGFFIWSATPVYLTDERHRNMWNVMVDLTSSMCWKTVSKTTDSTGVGFVVYQKPVSNTCYHDRSVDEPPLCKPKEENGTSWYVPLGGCISPLPSDSKGNILSWPKRWPERLTSKPPSISSEREAEDIFNEDTKHWASLVFDLYREGLDINWSKVRNVMDMNAGYGGLAAALSDLPLWVMNVVPFDAQDTLPVIYERGLIGLYHDWCESLNTYPRTYDLLHASFLFENLMQRCDLMDLAVEMDRILRPGGYFLMQDTIEVVQKIDPILHSLQWTTKLYQGQFLVGKKSFWRPKRDSERDRLWTSEDQTHLISR